MIALRDYQRDLLERSQEALAPDGARVMTQLPTGGGKTEIAGALLKGFLVDGRKAVWLTHREELAEQSADRLKEHWGIAAVPATEIWRRGRPAPYFPKGVAVLRAQTVTSRINDLEKNDELDKLWNDYRSDDLLVVDEVHHAPARGWETAIELWPGKVWGLTATPWRLSLREGFDHLFHPPLITGPQTSELQDNEHLARSRVFAPSSENRIIGKEIRQGEYAPIGIERANDRVIMTTLAVEFWQNVAAGRQTIAYAVSQRHACNLVEAFRDKGITADLILSTSETSQSERERVKRDFETGQITVLVNVAVVTEGFDLPDASCVMMTRPTKSLALYLQMVGRGLRRKDDGGDCLILDLAGNADEHGLPDKEREWSLAARGNPVAGEPPVSHCPGCYFTTHPARHKCPECGADLGKHCPRCGDFRPWSRWTVDCPIEHEAVCDRCHDDIHRKLGISRFNRNQDSLSYAKRAEEFYKEGNLEAALADYFFAIHVAKAENRPGQLAFWHTYRAAVHAEIGNIDLAEADFSAAESICEAGGLLTAFASLFMHQERAKMYDVLGFHDKADLDYQKAQEVKDTLNRAVEARLP